jgi:hypothetical protein
MTLYDELYNIMWDLKQVLIPEETFWYHSDVSKTAQSIEKYVVEIEVMIIPIRHHDLQTFIVLFRQSGLTVDALRSCFRQGDSKIQHASATRLLVKACDTMRQLIEDSTKTI